MLDDHWKLLQPLVEAYGHAHGIEFKITDLAYDELYSQVNLALTQRASTYDVVFLPDQWIPQFATLLEPLEISAELSAAIASAALNLARYPADAQPCALPWLGDTQFFVAHQDLLERFGLSIPETWDEALRSATRLAGAIGDDSQLAAFGMRMRTGHELVESFLPILRGYGTSLLDPVSGIPQLDTAPALAAMETFLRLAALSPTESKAIGEPSNADRFDLGQIAMMANYWASKLLAAADSESGTVVARSVQGGLQPAQTGLPRMAMTGVWFAAVPAGSMTIDAAVAFANWMVSAELQGQLASASLPPVRIDLVRGASVNQRPPALQTAASMLQQATARDRTPYYPQLEQLLATELAKALSGDVTGRDAMQNANLALRGFLVREGVLTG